MHLREATSGGLGDRQDRGLGWGARATLSLSTWDLEATSPSSSSSPAEDTSRAALGAPSTRSSSVLSARRCAALEPPAPDRLTSERADLEPLDRGSILPAQGEAHPLQRLSLAFFEASPPPSLSFPSSKLVTNSAGCIARPRLPSSETSHHLCTVFLRHHHALLTARVNANDESHDRLTSLARATSARRLPLPTHTHNGRLPELGRRDVGH